MQPLKEMKQCMQHKTRAAWPWRATVTCSFTGHRLTSKGEPTSQQYISTPCANAAWMYHPPTAGLHGTDWPVATTDLKILISLPGQFKYNCISLRTTRRVLHPLTFQLLNPRGGVRAAPFSCADVPTAANAITATRATTRSIAHE